MDSRSGPSPAIGAREGNFAVLQQAACSNQEGVVFDWMQASDCKHDQFAVFAGGLRRKKIVCAGINSHAPYHDFVRLDRGIPLENTLPVKFRDGHAKLAVFELCIEIGGVYQEIRSMQSHAEFDTQDAGRHHRNPRCEISVMHVDVFDTGFLEQQGVVNSKPSMQKRAQPTPRGLASLQQHPTIEILEGRELHEGQDRGVDQ